MLPRVFHGTKGAALVGGAHGKFVHREFAGHDGAGVGKVFNDAGIVGRDEVGEHFAAGGGTDAVGAEDVFVRHRDTVQRAEGLAFGAAGVAGVRCGAGMGKGRGEVGVERRVVLFNARDVVIAEFARTDVAGGEFGGELA